RRRASAAAGPRAATRPSVVALGSPHRVGRMASVIHSFDPPERFVAGTVGPPGQRTFFLQARTGARVTSVALEKQQVSVLAERIDELLDELLRTTEGESTIPAMPPVSLEDNGPLEQPIVEEIGEPEPDEILVVRLPAGLARAFSKRAAAVVAAGREPCPFCGGPMDPTGHLCPRANGFRRTAAEPEA